MPVLTCCMKYFLTIVRIDKKEGEEFSSLGRAYNKVDDGFKVRKRAFEALIANLINYPALCIFNFNESSVYSCYRQATISILRRIAFAAIMIGPAIWKQ
ncbi:MAG: hypothetical protein Q7T85_12270 [Nitrosomonas sp.]|nr:hypothetical protein [Nitrosomonas sp.]